MAYEGMTLEELARKYGGKLDSESKEEIAARKLGAKIEGYPTASARRGAPSPEKRREYLGYSGSDTGVVGSILRGAMDTIGGGAQLLSRGAAALGIVPETTGDDFFAGPAEVDAQNASIRQGITDRYGPESQGFDPLRVGTAAALTLPLAPTKFTQAPSMIGRALGAGGAGAVAGSMQEVRSPGTDFWSQKGSQAALGFGAGAVSQPIAEGVSAFNKLADKGVAVARDMTGANSMDQIVGMTREALKRSGIDFDAMSEAAKQSLLGDVQQALSKYSGTNPGAVARQAAFREEGFTPLRHWVTRDPAEFTWLENLSGVQGVGDQLKQRKADLDRFAQDRLSKMRGDAPLPEDVGLSAQKDLQNYLAQEKGKTNVLYDTFRDIAPDVTGDPQRFVGGVLDSLEGKMALGALPSNFQTILNKVSTGEIPLTPSFLYQWQKMAHGSRGADGNVNHALGVLSRAIDKELDTISNGIGAMDRSMPVAPGTKVPDKESAYAADALKLARAQSRKVAEELEGSKLLAAVDEGKAVPENFTDRLMGGSVRELAAAWMKLTPDSKANIRAQVLDSLKQKAFGSASDDAGKSAAQASFNAYLNDKTNSQKLKVILGERGLQEARRIGLMLESAHLAPSGSKVNTSNTAPALISYGTHLTDWMARKGIPGGRFVQDSARGVAAQGALAPDAMALGTRSVVIDPVVEELLKRGGGLGGALLGGVGAYPGLLGFVTPHQPTY